MSMTREELIDLEVKFTITNDWSVNNPPKGTSLIKWQTGEPKEEGFYLVTFRFFNNHGKNGITKAEWYNKHWYIGLNYPQEEILAWCKLSEVEPYKE